MTGRREGRGALEAVKHRGMMATVMEGKHTTIVT
jgi:hypothetical protein